MRGIASLLVFAVVASPAAAAAQQPAPTAELGGLSIGLRLGPAVPTGQFSDDGVEVGLGFGMEVIIHPSRHVALYAGFGSASYTPSDPQAFGFDDSSIDLTGYEAGVRVSPLAPGRFDPWVGGGLVYKEILIEAGGGWMLFSDETDHSFGYELAGGVGLAMSRHIYLTPALRYQRLSPGERLDTAFGMNDGWRVTDADQVLLDVGVAYRF